MQDLASIRDQARSELGVDTLLAQWRAHTPDDMLRLLDKLETLESRKRPLSRAEARTLRAHFETRPEIQAVLAMRDEEAPGIARLKGFARWLHHFESDWPADETGAPEPMRTGDDGVPIPESWAAREAERARLQEGIEADEGATAAEARGALDRMPFEKPELWAAYHDANHPGHVAAVAEVSRLHDVAAGPNGRDPAHGTITVGDGEADGGVAESGLVEPAPTDTATTEEKTGA